MEYTRGHTDEELKDIIKYAKESIVDFQRLIDQEQEEISFAIAVLRERNPPKPITPAVRHFSTGTEAGHFPIKQGA